LPYTDKLIKIINNLLLLAVIDYYKYPFLKGLDEEVAKYGKGITLNDLIGGENNQNVLNAKKRIISVIKSEPLEPYSRLRDSVIVFYTTIILIAILNNKILTEKYVDAETKVFLNELKNENEENLVEIAKQLGVKVELKPIEVVKREESKKGIKEKQIRLPFAINFIEYLKQTRRARKEYEELKLNMQFLKEGNVYLNKDKLLLLLESRVKDRLEVLIGSIKLNEVPESLKKLADDLRGRKTPPCILELQKRKELSEEEQKILITYYLNVGYDVDTQIFKEELVRKLKGDKRTRYIVYSCKRIRELGYCVSDCGVTNPLQLYYGKLT